MGAEADTARATVVHVITMLELGGAQENTLHTLRHLDRSRFRPHLMAGPGGILDDRARKLPDVPFVTIPHLVREIRPWQDLRALGELRRELGRVRRESRGPLLVHTHSSKAGILGRWAARAAGADAVVHSIHGYGFHPGQPAPLRGLLVLAERLTARVTTHFVAVSRANAEQGVRLGLFGPEDVSLIRSGIVVRDFVGPRRDPEAVRRDLGIPPGSPVVGMIACFKPQKAPLDFVRAARLVADEHPRARFLVVGDGELRPGIEEALRKSGLEGSTALLGWRDDVPDLLHAMDVVVLTSRWEGLPRVCPQAMAAGRPVVATAVDGTPEAVIHGETGFLAEPGDVAGIARAVGRLLGDPALARRMGEEGSRRVAEFDAGEMVRRQEDLYRRLLGGPAGER